MRTGLNGLGDAFPRASTTTGRFAPADQDWI
jgi:hypothetical protein